MEIRMSIRWLKGLIKSEKAKVVPPSSAMGNGKVDRAPRINLASLKGISVRLVDPPTSQEIRLANLSTTGMGLLRSSQVEWPPSGTVLKGALNLSGERHVFEARLVHLSSEVAGCVFLIRQWEFIEAFQRYFELELSALKLNQVNPLLLKKEEDGDARYFQGNGNEIFFVENSDAQGFQQVVRFHLIFMGNYFEGQKGKSVRFGSVVEEELKDKPTYPGSEMLSFTREVPDQMIEAARRFVDNIRELTPGQKSAILEMLAKS
jgi:hypothetical protein